MKAQMLKLAGVKTDAEFYKKFPTEASFMKKHGKSLKKAKGGATVIPGEDELQQLAPDEKPIGETGNFAFGTASNLIPEANSKNQLSVPKPSSKLKTAVGNKSGINGLFNNISTGFSKLDSEATRDIGMGLASSVGGILGGIEQIKADKKQLAELKKFGKISDIVGQAAGSPSEPIKQKYVRPESYLTNPTYALGRQGDPYLAENGAEIQNTYDPYTLYSDLGYEPLDESNMKQYKKGGKLKKAAGGFSLDPFAGIAGGIGGSLGSATGKGTGKGGPGSQIGSAIGGIAGSFIPIPGVGTALGSLAGGFLGGLFDGGQQNDAQEAQDNLDRNMEASALQSGIQGLQSQNSSFMEDGGYVSNNWNPQVITKFGDVDVSQLHTFANEGMPQYRAGGNLQYYTPPSNQAMETYAMGGDLQVHRGKAETMSYNPFLPNNGETVMFRGPSHDDGGMPISYGQNGVEVEGGEPAQVMGDGGTADGSLVVFGAIPGAPGGKTFKKYVAGLSKTEAKQNKIMDRATALVNDNNSTDPFDRLSFNSGQAMMMGATSKLKQLAEQKIDAAAEQNAILDTAEEYGYDDASKFYKDLKNDSVVAKFGGKFTSDGMAKGGKKIPKSNKKIDMAKMPVTLSSIAEDQNSAYLSPEQMRRNSVPNTLLDDVSVYSPKRSLPSPIFPSPIDSDGNYYMSTNPEEEQIVGQFPIMDYAPISQGGLLQNKLPQDTGVSREKNQREGFDYNTLAQTALSSIYPFIRPTLNQPLDPNQLAPEMLAASMNQLEPVQAQLYNPMLTQATSISLQDQLNEITSQSRAAERMTPYNPEAAAAIFGQASQAKSKILGEQFRMNQGEKQRVSEQNIATLNDAQMKNLSILDQQYARQAEGRSKTKTQAIEIAKSIAAKKQQNKLENRQQTTMENMYPAFNFTADGRAYKNPMMMASFNTQGMDNQKNTGSLAPGYGYTYDENRNIIGTRKLKADDPISRNGAIVKAIKNL